MAYYSLLCVLIDCALCGITLYYVGYVKILVGRLSYKTSSLHCTMYCYYMYIVIATCIPLLLII